MFAFVKESGDGKVTTVANMSSKRRDMEIRGPVVNWKSDDGAWHVDFTALGRQEFTLSNIHILGQQACKRRIFAQLLFQAS